jgi:Pyruvate/2-oxoacid:ferredoxin oxidoreductase delta subunit
MKEFLGIFLPLMGGVIAWYANERKKRQWEEYVRKEENYKVLIRSIKGFYADTHDQKIKEAFLEQLNLCWLYCPDNVITKAYDFLSTVQTGVISSHDVKEKALGDLIVTIRKDILSRNITKCTNLKAEDFKHLRAT